MFDYIVTTQFNLYEHLWNFSSTLVGACVGAYATYKAVDKSYKRNVELEEQKIKEKETIILKSIIAELAVLKKTYELQMDKLFNDVTEYSFLESVYVASYDYTTIYTNNAENIGFIKDEKLRNFIIEIHIIIKTLLENFKLYKDELDRLYHNRLIFISKIYPNKVHEECFYLDISNEIANIKNLIQTGNFSWAPVSKLTPEQITNFLISDDALIKSLIEFSNLMKNQYKTIRDLINKILEYPSGKEM